MLKKIRRWFSRPSNPAGNVYYVRLSTPQGKFYKIGYTGKSSLMERMAFGDLGDEKLIDQEFFFTFRRDAWDVEQELLDHFDRQRAFKKYSNAPSLPLPGRGQTELFFQDILGLDDNVYELTEEALKGAKTASEQGRDGCLMILIAVALAPFTLGWSLFFLLGGVSSFFGMSRGSQVASMRPKHPRRIQELIDDLSGRSVSKDGHLKGG